MPRQRRVGGTAQRVRQRGGGARAIDAIGRAGRRVGGNRHRRLPAQDIRTNAELGQDLGRGGNVRQGVQEVVEPHIGGAVELRHIVGAVAACQHQLVDRDRTGAGGLRVGAIGHPICRCGYWPWGEAGASQVRRRAAPASPDPCLCMPLRTLPGSGPKN